MARIGPALLATVLALGLLTGADTAKAASAVDGMERVTFTSRADLGSAEPLDLVGYLSRPDGPGPFPAVVLLHGCGGVQPNTAIWQAFFVRHGYAVFAVDSFQTRGVKEICRSTGQVTWTMRAADAFGALDHLVKQPFIRPDRVLAMGFSHGAGIALDIATTRRLKDRPAAAPRFRASLALYPACGYAVRRDADYRTPVFIGIGTADDWTPAPACEVLAARQSGTGMVELRLYQDAAHSFDNIGRPVRFLPDVLNRNRSDGRGATVGGSPDALAAVQADVERFLDVTLR